MGKPGKHSDEAWDRAFAREKAGERRGDLAVELGVSISTMNWQARKRGLKRGVTPGWVDHRKRPARGWPADHVFSQSRSGMTRRRWRGLLARYVAGEAIGGLAMEYGVSKGAISRQAQAMAMRKADRADAVFRARGPWAGGLPPGRPEMAFHFDRHNPQATGDDLARVVRQAVEAGRLADALALVRCWTTMGRLARQVERWKMRYS